MERHIIIAITLSAVITASMRALPIILLSRFRLSITAQQWLNFIPSAIMAAIIAAEVLNKPALTAMGISISLVAAIFAGVSGVLSRSLFITVMSGMLAYSTLFYFYGVR
ncbi:AzlD domain-containing protein [Dickeya zeae]|uniref:AzlD domain-containing protein n=1 Tax=Dickeya zeae TaxID=204042 RepID=UPI000575E34D|nr:AzlD domain-containing protein [Dickeya zeae]